MVKNGKGRTGKEGEQRCEKNGKSGRRKRD
jgi:hypothetical protein